MGGDGSSDVKAAVTRLKKQFHSTQKVFQIADESSHDWSCPSSRNLPEVFHAETPSVFKAPLPLIESRPASNAGSNQKNPPPDTAKGGGLAQSHPHFDGGALKEINKNHAGRVWGPEYNCTPAAEGSGPLLVLSCFCWGGRGWRFSNYITRSNLKHTVSFTHTPRQRQMFGILLFLSPNL